jgi:hypothetical protein
LTNLANRFSSGPSRYNLRGNRQQRAAQYRGANGDEDPTLGGFIVEEEEEEDSESGSGDGDPSFNGDISDGDFERQRRRLESLNRDRAAQGQANGGGVRNGNRMDEEDTEEEDVSFPRPNRTEQFLNAIGDPDAEEKLEESFRIKKKENQAEQKRLNLRAHNGDYELKFTEAELEEIEGMMNSNQPLRPRNVNKSITIDNSDATLQQEQNSRFDSHLQNELQNQSGSEMLIEEDMSENSTRVVVRRNSRFQDNDFADEFTTHRISQGFGNNQPNRNSETGQILHGDNGGAGGGRQRMNTRSTGLNGIEVDIRVENGRVIERPNTAYNNRGRDYCK